MKFTLGSFVFIALLINTALGAQELEGKWIVSGNKSFSEFPGIHVMHVSADSLSHYNFDQFITKTSYHTSENQLKLDTLIFADFNFKNANRLSISSKRLKDPIDYIRLIPTKTTLSSEEIKQIRYNLKRGGRNFEIDFKNHPDNKIVHSYLKKIDKTFFLVIYRYGNIVTAVPIEEITRDKLFLYGFPDKPNQLVARAIK